MREAMSARATATVHGWLLLLPAMALLVAFTHWPAVATFIDSFYSTPRPRRPSRFVGLDNYEQILADPVFWQSLSNNLLFALGTIPVSIALALVMALWVNDRITGRTLVRMAYFTPTVLPMIAVANIWLFFYTPQYGLLEQITGALGLPSHNWLGDRSTVLGAMIVVAIWKEAGFFMMTRGGPDNASALLLYYIYQVGFSFWDSAYAAALTVVVLVVLGVTAFVKF